MGDIQNSTTSRDVFETLLQLVNTYRFLTRMKGVMCILWIKNGRFFNQVGKSSMYAENMYYLIQPNANNLSIVKNEVFCGSY